MSDPSLEELDELLEQYRMEEYGHVRESYFLNNWYRYKKYLKELCGTELQSAKTLFRGLKELSSEDREFLALKYDKPKRPHDKTTASELGMALKTYSKKRRAIQKELKIIMIKQKLEEYKK